ncbi:MAG: hypothetical protein WCJ53_06765 [Mycobacteriaceae bacterium]
MRATARTRGRYGWLSAGTLAVGLGAALVGGPGVAHADAVDSASPGAATRSASPHAPAPVRARRAAISTTADRDSTVAKRTVLSTAAVDNTVPRASTAVAAAAAPVAATPAATTYTAGSKLPPRIQWDANYGYCGETAFISAGLNYGQYISQYDARALASNNTRQSLESSQLLLGVNDVAAAKAMHLSATAFNTTKQPTSTAFLTWVKSNVTAGYPVVIGVFMNQSRFYGTANLNAGDTEYDHIVTVTGITSTRPLTGPATYYADDVLTFNDNGEWTGTNGQPQNAFSYTFGTFATTRQKANAKTAAVYSLKSGADYGIAITGIIDGSRETVPVRLTTSVNAETPVMVDGSNTRPAAKPVTLTITVSSLRPGTTYNLYRYNSMANVPDSNINANAAKAAQKWTITIPSGSTYTMTQTINSNEVAVYRAVPVGAP